MKMRPLTYQNEGGAQDFGAWDGLAATRGEADFCSREGAMALKEKIEAYWRERGQNVMIALHNVGFHPAIRAARYDVRSDMVNGMPRATPKTRSTPVEQQFEEFDEDDHLVVD
jgi:hypothetical protein